MLFYAAAHYVGAFFVKQGTTCTMHKTRDSAIQRDARLSKIYREYRELEHFSRQARYDSPMGYHRHGDVAYLMSCLEKVRAAVLPLL